MKSGQDLAIKVHPGKRMPIVLPLYYGPFQDVMFNSRCADISLGGLYLQTEVPLSADESIEVIFSLPNYPTPIICHVKVAWTNPALRRRKPELPPGVGVEFVGLAETESTAIANFIMALS